MKSWLLILASAFAAMGCTTISLNRHTLAQSASVVELRYYEVLDNLAMVADDPSALPAYSSIFAGTAQVTDTEQLTSTTNWQHVLGVGGQNGFASEAANPQLNRAVLENWTLDPIVIPEKLEALRCACQWVLYGPDHICSDCAGLLATPEQAPTPGRHFGVADRLARLPSGWLHVGRLKDVPLTARYKAHCGDAWVWVMPDGMEGLADFTIVFQDIARVDSNSPTLFYIRLAPSGFTFRTLDWLSPEGKTIGVTGSVAVDPWMNLVSDTPYYRWRVETVGSDAHLRSQVNAAGLR